MNVAEIIDRHRSECESVRKLVVEAMQYHNTDFQKSKELIEFAKLAGEAVAILQASERNAFAIDNSVIDLVERALFVKAKRMSGK